MVWGRLIREVVYAGIGGFGIAVVGTVFTVSAVGLPAVVGLDGIVYASAVSIAFGSVAATLSLYARLEREARREPIRAP